MKIYTKTGDTGSTSLFGGARVNKNHIRIETYGTVDELNSWIGMLRDFEIDTIQKQELLEVQNVLFTLGSHLATEKPELIAKLPKYGKADVERLEGNIDAMNEVLPPITSFILPGGNIKNSHAHVARCVCRRAERLVVALSEVTEIDALIIIYLNRLSDYLFTLARKISFDDKSGETPWITRA